MAETTLAPQPPATTTPAAPSLPASVTLPSNPAAGATDTHNAEPEPPSRDDSWSNLFEKPAEPAAPTAALPAKEEPSKPTPAPEKPAPAPAKPAEPTPAVTPKPEDKPATAKPAEGEKPPADGDELPEDLMEGIEENAPAKHLDAVKRANKMGKRLRLADVERKKLKEELAQAKAGGGIVPPDYEEIKTRAARLQADFDAREKELNETRERLYANELTSRPEFQEKVTKPWVAVQDSVAAICKRYGQNPADVWSAFGMQKAEERDAIFSEMMTVMNPLDQSRFTAAIEAVPRISAEQARLQANSKDRLEAFKQQDTERAERDRSQTIGRVAAAQKQHTEKQRTDFPFLYKMDGDTPEVKAYNTRMDDAIKLADQLANGGVDKLSPEMQGMMLHDAVTADLIKRNLGGIMQMQAQRVRDQQAEIEELKTANKSLQSKVDEYDGAVPAGGGASTSASGTNGAVVPTDAPLTARISQHAGAFGWSG